MKEFLQIALSKKPGDPIATEQLSQLEDAVRKEDLKNEQYRNAINAADKFFEEGDLDNALVFYTQAVTIEPNSVHSKERIKELHKMKEDAQKAIECLTKAEVFEGQKLYAKALTELRKASLLDPSNKDTQSKIEEIEALLSAKEKKISDLKTLLNSSESNGNYASAVTACKDLAVCDEDNHAKWERKAEELEKKKEKEEEKAKILHECKKMVDDASFNDEWNKVFNAATKALSYSPGDEFFQKYLTKATAEIAKKKASEVGKAVVDTAKVAKENGKKIMGGISKQVDDFFGTVTKPSVKKALSEKKEDNFFSSVNPIKSKPEPKKPESKKPKDLDGWDF